MNYLLGLKTDNPVISGTPVAPGTEVVGWSHLQQGLTHCYKHNDIKYFCIYEKI